MKKVTIIGAGLVGSLWAYLLKKEGLDVEVYEKRPDPRLHKEQAGRSINLVITSRGLFGLEKAELIEKILPITVPVYGRMMHSTSGELVYQPYGRDQSECNYSVSRGILNRTLIEACLEMGVKIHFDHSLKLADLDKKELTFSTSSETVRANYNLVFGTDGAGSILRHEMAKKNSDPDFEHTDWLASDYKELYMPPGSPFEKNALHIWPRGSHMMMGLANLDGSFTMTLYLPRKNSPASFEKVHTPEEVRKFFETEFADSLPHMPHYLEEFINNPQGQLGTVRCKKWVYQDSVALIGDAAHAIVPFFGQGMNLGFEDATTLLEIGRRNKFSNWSEILKEYDEKQRPNANAIADMALENFVEMRDRVGDAQFLFRKKVETLLEKEFPELYRSRYGMITYTLIPYSVAQKAGEIQSEILQKLTSKIHSPEELDRKQAHEMLRSEFYPWLQKQGYSTRSYTPRTFTSNTLR